MVENSNFSKEIYYPTKEEFLLLFKGLTKRQKEVVLRKCGGKTDKEIALEFGFKPKTTRKHISNACARLLISNPYVIRNNGNRETLIRLGTMYLFD